jgi:virginiamycin B lyase
VHRRRNSSQPPLTKLPLNTRVPVVNRNVVWLSDFGANAMLHFDPKTEQFTVIKSKSRNASVRLILGRPGEVWLPESGADKLVMIRE